MNKPILNNDVMNMATNTWSVARAFFDLSMYNPSPAEPPTHSPMVAATTL